MPVLLLDGVVGGIWESTRGARRIAIRVQPLLALDRKRRRAIDDAAARIGEIVGLEPTVTIGRVSTRPHL
jgi:hypothetical protein